MADTREIVVTIRNEGGGGGQTVVPGSPGKPDDSASGKTANKTADAVSDAALERQQAMITIAVQLGERALKQAANTVVQNADFLIERSYYLKDDYIGQRTYNEAKAAITGIAQDAASIASWSSLGPAGLAVGALLTVGSRAIGFAKNVDAQNLRLKQMDATLQFGRQRAGFSLSGGSVGENL